MTGDEQAATRTERCLFCSSRPGEPCSAWSRYAAGPPRKARRPHVARMKLWRAAQHSPPLRETDHRETGEDDD